MEVKERNGRIPGKDLRRAYGWRFFGVIFEGTGPSVFKVLLGIGVVANLGVMYFLFFGGITTLFLAWSRIQEKRTATFIDLFKKSFQEEIAWRLTIAGLSTAGLFICYIYAMQLESVTEAGIIVRVEPVLRILLATFILKENIKSWLGIIGSATICLFGLAAIKGVTSFSFVNLFSLFFLVGIAAAFFTAITAVFETDVRNRLILGQGQKEKLTNIINLFITGTVMMIGGLALFFYLTVSGESLIIPSGQSLLLLLYLGVMTIALGKIASLKAYAITKNLSMFAFINYFIPIIVALSAYFINQEKGFNYFSLFVGFLLIIGGSYLANKCIEKK